MSYAIMKRNIANHDWSCQWDGWYANREDAERMFKHWVETCPNEQVSLVEMIDCNFKKKPKLKIQSLEEFMGEE